MTTYKCECGCTLLDRCNIGPYDGDFMVLGDWCVKCRTFYPLYELSDKENKWLQEFNKDKKYV